MGTCFGKERKGSEKVVAGCSKGLPYSGLIQEIIFGSLLMGRRTIFEERGADIIGASSSINAFYFQAQRTIGIGESIDRQIISLGIYGIHRIDAPPYG